MAFFLFVALTAIGMILVLVMERDRRAEHRRDLNDFVTVVAQSLERQLQRSLSSTFTLAALIRQSDDRTILDFDSVAAEIIETFGGIDSLQLAPGGIVAQIYPLEGNEQAIGHDLLNDPARRAESLKTIESGRLTLAGPFELVQGGTAVIGRLPVFVPNDQGGESWWGFTIALIRLPNLLAAINLPMGAEQGHDYWLDRVHPDTGLRDVIAASTERDLQGSVTFNIEVPNGSWALHLRHSDNRSALWFLLEISLVVIFSAMASLLFYTRLQRAATRKIARQALDIEINERRRLEAAELELVKELSVVDEVARVITSTLDIQEGYGEFAQQLGQLVEFDHVAIAVIDQDAGTVEYKYSYGQTLPGYDGGQIVPLEGTRTQKVFMTGQTLVTEDTAARPQFNADPMHSQFGLRASISTPLNHKGQVFGALHLRSEKVVAFGLREQAIIERLANQIAPAVRNAELFEQSRRAEEATRISEEKYRTLVNQSPDMIFVSRIDDFGFTEVNDRACEHYGYSRQEFLTMTIFDIEIEPPLPEHLRSLYDDTPQGQVVEFYGTNQRMDGTTFPVHVRFAKLNEVLAIANVRDVTEQRELERIKDEFVSVVSHELRTPVTSIKGFLELLRDEETGPLTQEQKRYLGGVGRSTTRLEKLVTDLLDISLLDSGTFRLDRTTFDLVEVVQHVMADMRSEIDAKGLKIRTTATAPDIKIDADRNRTIQILANLIGNAVKFSLDGSSVDIEIISLRDKNFLHVNVHDQGPGVADEDNEKLFQNFPAQIIRQLAPQRGLA